MSSLVTYDGGVAARIGRYSDAVRIPAGAELVHVSGTPGLDRDGRIPTDFEEEARQAWRNIDSILTSAGTSLGRIVMVRQYLTRAADIPAYVAVRSEVIRHKPAFMLMVVSGLVWPDINLEIEVEALADPLD